MEAININTFIIINYAALIGLAFLLAWSFGRKTSLLKKITTVCVLTFVFIIGLPIAELTSHYFYQAIMTQERYEWVIAHPNTFFIYKNLLSLLYTMILSGIFLQRKPKDYYESCPSFIIPFILLITAGINYLTIFIINLDVYPYSTLFNNIGIIVIFISLLTIIFALWPSRGHATYEPKVGVFFAIVTLIVFSLKLGMVCYLMYTGQNLQLFYAQNTLNMLIQTVCLSLILLSGLLLLRYIAYQNPMNVQFNLFTSLGGFTKRAIILISTGAAFALTLFFLTYTPFETQVKKLWIEEFNTGRNTGEACLSSPVRLENGLEWTLSIPKIDPNIKSEKPSYYSNELTHSQKIARLDALTNIGFLKKYEEEILITVKGDNRYVSGFRYHITPNFKAYSSGGTYPCLKYSNKGMQFLGIDSTTDLMKEFSDQDRKTLKQYNITKYIEVKFFVGVQENDLFPWVKDPSIVQAFDFKPKKIQSIKIVNIAGNLMHVDNLRIDSIKSIAPNEAKKMLKQQEQFQERQRMQNRWDNMRSSSDHITVYPHQIKSGKFPKKSRVLNKFKEEYQSGRRWNSSWHRLDRPGSTSDLPVDIKNDTGGCDGSKPYKVGIITEENTLIEKRDKRILNNTLPYLQNLVERGILFSYEGQISLKNQNNQSYSGLYFEPTEQYQKAFSLCLNLNEPRFEMLKVSGDFSPFVSFDTVAYYKRPSWATDEMLKNFEELRLILEYGSTNIARNPAYDLPFKVRNTPIRY